MNRPIAYRFAVLAVVIGVACGFVRPAAADEPTQEEIRELLKERCSVATNPKTGNVGSFSLQGKDNADACLEKLKDCKDISGAAVSATAGLTDKGLECLKGMTKMYDLKLWGGKYTEKGLAGLTTFTRLTLVEIAVPDTGEGLSFLKGNKVKTLKLTGTKITADSFKILKELDDLEELYLRDVPIDDKGLAHLAGLKKLKRLDLINTKITNASIPTLKKLTTLELLFVPKVRKEVVGKKTVVYGIDDKGSAELQKAFKNIFAYDRN